MADGTFSSPHSGPCRAASIVQRGVVQGSVVVVEAAVLVVVVLTAGVVVELAGDVEVDAPLSAEPRGSACRARVA